MNIAIASNGVEINTGDAVLVRDDTNDFWRYNVFSHILIDNPFPYRAVSSVKGVYVGYKYCIPYKGNEHLVGTTKEYNVSKKKSLTYEEKQKRWVKRHDIKVGDKVRITRKADSHENGWENNWSFNMNNAIGKIGTIIIIHNRDTENYGILVSIDNFTDYWYPYHILEKVNNVSEPEFKFGTKVRAKLGFKTVEGILIGYRKHRSYKEKCEWRYMYKIATNDSVDEYSIGDTHWVSEIEYL